MSPGLALFVKTPGRSPVKSRLWPALGREAAETLYLDCAAAAAEVVSALQHEGLLQAYWAVAETPDESASPWQGLPRLNQGDGGLGERMGHVYAALRDRHGAALLVGTDVPQMPAAALRHAISTLQNDEADVVLGPSEDGGFWLVGGRSVIPLSAWTAPRYSGPDARSDFLAALPTGLRIVQVDSVRDLDEPQDLSAVALALSALTQRTPAQERVLRRLDTLRETMSP